MLRRDHTARVFAVVLCVLGPMGTSRAIAQDTAPPVQRVAILADAHGHGELHPCRCPGLDSSSLALRATVLKRARTYTYPAVVLEGGDFTAPEDDSLRNERFALFVDAMTSMEYDAVALGGEELGLPASALQDAVAKLPLVCTNLRDPQTWGIPPVRRVERGGYHVLIAAYVDPSLVMGKVLVDPVESLARVLPRAPAPDSTIVILLAHSSESQFRQVLERFPAVDVAVRSHDPEDGPALETLNLVPVLLPAPKGRNVVQLTGDFTPLGALSTRTVRTWELKQEQRGHARLDALVRVFETRHGLE